MTDKKLFVKTAEYLILVRNQKANPSHLCSLVNKRFQNKTVWISGASSGIGAELAKQLNTIGAQVIISARRVELLEQLRNTCTYPEKVIVLPMDLTNQDSMKDAVEFVEKNGRLDLLIHNAGIAQKGLVKDNDILVDRQIMETNYFGTINLTKKVLPIFLKQKEGWFAVVTSVAGIAGVPGRSAYSASKHALHGFFDSLRAELMDCDLDVTIIMPGFIDTHITYKELKSDGRPYGHGEKSHKQGMSPEDCARKIIKHLHKNRQNIIVGGVEVSSVYAQRFMPRFYNFVIRRHPMKLWRKFLRFLGFKR